MMRHLSSSVQRRKSVDAEVKAAVQNLTNHRNAPFADTPAHWRNIAIVNLAS